MEETSNQDDQHLFSLLKSFQKASKDLQKSPLFSSHEPQSTVERFLDLEKDESVAFDDHPNLFKLSQMLCNHKTHLEKLQKYQGHSLPCILGRQIINYKIYQVAYAIETEIRAYFGRESDQNLVGTLESSADEDEKVNVLVEFENRLSQGFDIHFQDLILKAKIFSILELLLCDSSCSIRIRVLSLLIKREAIEAMLEAGLVEKLVKFQISEKQASVDENGTTNEDGSKSEQKTDNTEEGYEGNCPFEGCVARFC
ncbi:hypothetical protein F3Y22_tig00110557pilonHSYRG00209 [Hibiscus syriacus]|uniref:Uncharacterized protein n=1 Tax=Hibiscus syriacus TaxID=106335 RepID=A0A6A3A868_HIBSY|nr:hypothetical protein F3Y22_tig00110557pilonHSYRG00209 [Hibiscus syriacus]